tara:strand:+ start:352 stop:495 length:144 start_codon:yes stop_codon:yes gene_type:complete
MEMITIGPVAAVAVLTMVLALTGLMEVSVAVVAVPDTSKMVLVVLLL